MSLVFRISVLSLFLVASREGSSQQAAAFLVERQPHCYLRPTTTDSCRHRSSDFRYQPLLLPQSRLSEKVTDDDLGLKKLKIGDQDFWTRQRELVSEMQDESEKRVRADQREKFAQRRLALVGDTAYFGFFIFCALWTFFDNPFVAISYSFGATMGTLYAYGLGKYVETLGGNVDDAEAVQGAGVGEARFAFLILLFVFVGKFRAQGLLEIPSIAGFFTYQIASLSQGLREIND